MPNLFNKVLSAYSSVDALYVHPHPGWHKHSVLYQIQEAYDKVSNIMDLTTMDRRGIQAKIGKKLILDEPFLH